MENRQQSQNNMNKSQGGNETSAPRPKNQEGSVGALIGSIIIILIIIAGGIYFYNTAEKINHPDNGQNTEQRNSGSTDVSDIDSELNATTFSEMEAELAEIEAEMEAAEAESQN